MNKKKLFLVCNAHLDPVWLWDWEEGLAETLSTFRTAARFCDEFDGFVFCHNESVLYKWIEEYEPGLFKKIQELVEQKKWHIMGGWFVQPDCNLPSGESFVRQGLQGKKYFLEKFKTEPKTAVNFDPFGHTRGLVQILKKSGYTAYLFCRPDVKSLDLENNDFIWVGYDGSEILARRAIEHYGSQRGKARSRIEKWIKDNPEKDVGMLPWGIGNHGGGPSKFDLEQIEQKQKTEKVWEIIHGTPDEYFAALEEQKESLPKHRRDLNPWAVGCYTSMVQIKQKHRLLENIYYQTEKMLTIATLHELMKYPKQELREALEDLLYGEFHDILPGEAIQDVEVHGLRRFDHGIEILQRLRARAFFSLLSGQKTGAEGEFPLFIYNHFPYEIEENVVCEFQPPEPNFYWNIFKVPEVTDSNGNVILTQLEKERSNIQVDQRKRVVFKTKLQPGMNRYSCFLKDSNVGSEQLLDREDETLFEFKNETCEIGINKKTGLIDFYKVFGDEMLNKDSLQLLVMKDYPDPWGMKVGSFRNLAGKFTLMNEEESALFAGVNIRTLAPVRIIENGAIRAVVEALFKFNNSNACVRYFIPKCGCEIEVEVKVFWQEKDKMLKLSVPSKFDNSNCLGQVAYGVEEFDRFGEELVAHKWISILSEEKKLGLTIVNNGTYGFDFENGEARLSLLRSAAYAAHPVADHIPILKQHRFETRMDQGERTFRFWIKAGMGNERMENIDREALIKNEFPMTLCCFPTGKGNKTEPGIILSNQAVQLNTFKIAEENNNLIFRLFEPTGRIQKTTIKIPYLNIEFDVELNRFEIKTIAINIETKEYFETDLLERKLDEQ
jgi:alpha-mannosidase